MSICTYGAQNQLLSIRSSGRRILIKVVVDSLYRVTDTNTCKIPKYLTKEQVFDLLLAVSGADAWDMFEILNKMQSLAINL